MTEAAVRRFFQSPQFAVAGANNDSNRFGYKSQSHHIVMKLARI